jgi:carbon-monoxide dehydrogenase large subunit
LRVPLYGTFGDLPACPFSFAKLTMDVIASSFDYGIDLDQPSGVGARMLRREDGRLLKGSGRFVADIVLPGEAHAVLVRSVHPHARIHRIDTTAARAMVGVLAVLTGADAEEDGLGGIPWEVRPPVPPGTDPKSLPPLGAPEVAPPQPVLARGCVRYVGEIVAIVVADTVNRARDAAEAVEIHYDPLPSVIATADSVLPGAAQLWPQFPGNVCFSYRQGDHDAMEAAFATADHVTRLDLVNTRLVASPLETRGYIGEYDAASGRYTLFAAAGKPNPIRRTLARDVFDIAEDRIRVVAKDVGGGFGTKNVAYVEEALVLWVARRIGRPVKWISDRSESFLSDVQGRDQVNRSALALDAEGNFLAIRVATIVNLGAYLGPRGVNPPISGTKLLASVYRLPVAYIEVQGVFTNTVPTCPYRGAGHPEVIYQVERLVDTAAREMGFDPAALRQRNLIPTSAMPHRTVTDIIYDSGDFERNMTVALQAADWQGFYARRAAAATRGRLRGIGISNCLEASSFGPEQKAWVDVAEDGSVQVRIGTQSSGQSHETVYSQIVAEQLGIPITDIRIIQGDTDLVPGGDGTGACRSIVLDGSALKVTLDSLIEKSKRIAAHRLEAAIEDIEFSAGRFAIAGTDRSITFAEVARAARDASLRPPSSDEGLGAVETFKPTSHTFPNGCHVCEVEIDPETGATEICAYTMIHDAGRIINPTVVEGQLHGGVVQGIGQALMEHAIWDSESGQMINGSFMDYSLPRANTVPSFHLALQEIPTTANPLGVKGIGEAGPTAAPPAVINAIVDALGPYGVLHVPMPASPQRIWQIIRDAMRL